MTWQNLISSNSFSLWITAVTFEHLNVWFPIWFNRTVQVIYRIDITVSLFYPCFLAANFTIYCLNFAERIDSFILVYCMSKSDILTYLYRKGHLAIVVFIKFTLSSEFDEFVCTTWYMLKVIVRDTSNPLLKQLYARPFYSLINWEGVVSVRWTSSNPKLQEKNCWKVSPF